MYMNLWARRVLAGGWIFILTGCGGGNPTPGTVICSTPALPSVQLLYPPPNAQGVATNVSTVLYAGLQSYTITLSGPNSTSLATTSAAAPLALPQGSATPMPGTNTYAVSVGALQPSATYHVTATIPQNPSEACDIGPQAQVVIGSFSTR
jgi:hypothetical protein